MMAVTTVEYTRYRNCGSTGSARPRILKREMSLRKVYRELGTSTVDLPGSYHVHIGKEQAHSPILHTHEQEFALPLTILYQLPYALTTLSRKSGSGTFDISHDMLSCQTVHGMK